MSDNFLGLKMPNRNCNNVLMLVYRYLKEKRVYTGFLFSSNQFFSFYPKTVKSQADSYINICEFWFLKMILVSSHKFVYTKITFFVN